MNFSVLDLGSGFNGFIEECDSFLPFCLEGVASPVEKFIASYFGVEVVATSSNRLGRSLSGASLRFFAIIGGYENKRKIVGILL